MWAVYLIDVLRGLSSILLLITIFGGVFYFFGITAVFSNVGMPDQAPLPKTIITSKWWLLYILLVIANQLIPSEKTMYTMLGIKVSEEVIKNKTVQTVSDKVILLVNKKLDSYLEEVKK